MVMKQEIIIIFAGLLLGLEASSRLFALWNLEEMCLCQLGYDAFGYINYGCWCGIGGSGSPMDGIDRCCMHHDACYDEAVDKGICLFTPEEYVDPYHWKCMNSTPICEDNGWSTCASWLCACDQTLVNCWSRFPKPMLKPKCLGDNRTKQRPSAPSNNSSTSLLGTIHRWLEIAALQQRSGPVAISSWSDSTSGNSNSQPYIVFANGLAILISLLFAI